MKRKNAYVIGRIAALAIFVAMMVVMNLFQIGFIRIGPVEITFYMILVALGASLYGFGFGAVIGGTFGVLSFLQCLSGASAFGTLIFTESPVLAFIVCVPTRILAGVVAALVFRLMPKKSAALETVSYSVSAVAASLANTVLFVGTLLLFFFGNANFRDFFGGATVWGVITALVTANAFVELAVNTVVVTVLAKALAPILKKERAKNQ